MRTMKCKYPVRRHVNALVLQYDGAGPTAPFFGR